MKVGIFATHPVQYHVPLWRGLAAVADLDSKVFYMSDQGVSAKIDPGFGEIVTWDVPLLDRSSYEFLRKDSIQTVTRSPIPDLAKFLTKERFDVVLLNGYMHRFARQLVCMKRRFGYNIALRGEFTDMAERNRPRWKRTLRDSYLK